VGKVGQLAGKTNKEAGKAWLVSQKLNFKNVPNKPSYAPFKNSTFDSHPERKK